MKIIADRTEFDAALADPRNIFLLLFGETEAAAGAIHDKAEQIISESYKKTVWVTAVDILTRTEKDAWYSADNQCTLVARSSDGKSWVVKAQKALSDLCTSSGKPSSKKIRGAFAEAEQ